MSAESFYTTFANVVSEDKRKTREWIDCLRSKGIRAAHPDDGWVNRDTNEVILTYPYFGKILEIGDSIALGDYREYRIVHVTNIREGYVGNLKYYKFAESKW